MLAAAILMVDEKRPYKRGSTNDQRLAPGVREIVARDCGTGKDIKK